MSRLGRDIEPQRVLIIKPSSLGDVTHAIPVLFRLRRRWPHAHIAWLVAPSCAGLLEGQPALDEVCMFDRHRFGSAWRNPVAGVELIRFARQLRRRTFDLVIDLQGLLRSGWMAWQTRAPLRVGFANAREGARFFYTHQVHPGDLEQHAVDRYLQVAGFLGCIEGGVRFDFQVKEADRQRIRSLVSCEEPIAVLLPGANWPTKRWPADRFAALVAPLRQRLGLRSVVAGGPEVAEIARQIPDALNLAGQTNLPELVALLERADLVIANDSGPMHIAAALGRPLVAIFGPTNPVRTGPYGRPESVVRLDISCSPCYSRRCSHQSCLQWLDVDPVLAAAARELHEAGSASNTTYLDRGA